MVRDSRLHGWRYSQTGMNPTKVVPRKMQAERGFQVIQLLAKSIG